MELSEEFVGLPQIYSRYLWRANMDALFQNSIDIVPKMALPSDFGLVFESKHTDLTFCLEGDFSHLSHRSFCPA